MRIYTIWGVSFCGSTLLSNVLAKAPEIFNLGESHWLLDNISKCWCQIHRNECDFWTYNFKKEIQEENLFKTIFAKAKKKYNIKALLLSDKNSYFYKEYYRKGKNFNSGILLYKRPEAFIASWIRKPNNMKNFDNRRDAILKAMNIYYQNYKLNLGFLNKWYVPYFLVSFEDFCKTPKIITRKLCNFLNITYHDEMIKYYEVDNKNHYLGGNTFINYNIEGKANLNKLLKKFTSKKDQGKWYKKGKKIRLDERWKEELTEKEKRIIRKNQKLQILYNTMELLKNKRR